MRLFIKLLLSLMIFFTLTDCSSNEKTDLTKKDSEKQLPTNQKSELKETSIQMRGISQDTKLENETGILVVRFILEDSPKNVLEKLPNFRIKGPKDLEIDNSPTDIRKDAVHIYVLPVGKYMISSIYSINDKGEYQFDKPFPSNSFTILPSKINYVGDIRVRVEEESKTGSVYSQKLKLKLPANNDETITVIQDKLKSVLSKYPLERTIISFQ